MGATALTNAKITITAPEPSGKMVGDKNSQRTQINHKTVSSRYGNEGRQKISGRLFHQIDNECNRGNPTGKLYQGIYSRELHQVVSEPGGTQRSGTVSPARHKCTPWDCVYPNNAVHLPAGHQTCC